MLWMDESDGSYQHSRRCIEGRKNNKKKKTKKKNKKNNIIITTDVHILGQM